MNLSAVNKESISAEINGTYTNETTDSSTTLWFELSSLNNRLIKRNDINYEKYNLDALVHISYSEPNLYISVYQNDSLCNSLVLKAKIKENYISVNRDFKLVPIPLFWLYAETKICLAKNLQNNTLILNTVNKGVAYVLIIGNGNTNEKSISFTPFLK